MATIGQIRGAILEEVVLYLLRKVGYKIVRLPGDSIDSSDLKSGGSGLELQGRGTWHQIDAIAEQNHTPAFTYPLRLLVEAKFYTTQSVGIDVVRNSVGVHKDISENYFSKHRSNVGYTSIRFNYQSAIFSASGYTKRAMDYAIAHQIFLIEYKKIPVMEPVIQGIRSIDDDSLTREGMDNISEIRAVFREMFRGGEVPLRDSRLFTDTGIDIVNNSVVQSIQQIGGSYFGMLQGRWPLHLLTEEPLSPSAFSSDTVSCRLRGNREGQWSFSPSDLNQGDDGWFELQFFLPAELAKLVGQSWGDPLAIAETKSQNFSFIALSGVIGGTWRNVRLELDRTWLERYLHQFRT